MGTISVSHISKAYKAYPSRWARLVEWLVPFSKPRHQVKWALKDIHFETKAGEAIGILGLNGAGKSTLLKLMTGTSHPTTGSITSDGSVAAILELGMGFHPDFTGRQNVFMAGQLLGLSTSEINDLMPEIIEFAELAEVMDEPVRIYSSGMSMRLAFAVATAKRPDTLIVDEALSVGDAYFQHKSFSRIRTFQEQGTTLLLVSHDIAAVRGMCDRAIWLEKGRVKLQGACKDVVDAYSSALYAQGQDINFGEANEDEIVIPKRKPSDWKRDARQDLINHSNLRNDIEVLDFNEDTPRWGDGAAKIISIVVTDDEGTPFSWMIGGEAVKLSVEAVALRDLEKVSIGFLVRDRLGQALFGDNTIVTTLDAPKSVKKGQTFTATFRFLMPMLPKGAYTITAAVAVGSQQCHVVNDWVNQGVVLHSNNMTSFGLMGIPMQEISLEVDA